MTQILLRLTVLLIGLAGSGCQAWMPAAGYPRGDWIGWLDPAQFGPPVQASQMLHGHFQGQTFSMPAALEIGPSQMTLVGFSHIGGALFSASLAQGVVTTARAPLLPKGFSSERMLRDVQLALWPQEQLSRHLQGGVSLQQQGSERQFLWRGQPFIRISYGHADRLGGSIEFEHLGLHYRWMLVTLDTTQPADSDGGAP